MKPEADCPGVVVLGMHRGGTSVATRLVSMMGPALPREDQLIGANDGNPTGYWEVAELTELNEGILEAFEGSWAAPPVLPAAWQHDTRLKPLVERADAAFTLAHPREPWVWKDPRNCLLLPLWLDILGARPAAVLVVRNPLEVWRSLERRHRLTRVYSFALWERYMRRALDAARGLAVHVSTFSALVDDPASWCSGVCAFLRGQSMDVHPPDARQVEEFVSSSLRHHAAQTEEFLRRDDAASAQQKELIGRLEALAGCHASFDPGQLPPETPSTSLLIAQHRGLADANRQVELKDTHIRNIETLLSQREAEATRLSEVVEDLQRRGARADELETENARLRGVEEGLHEEIGRSTAARIALAATVEEQAAALAVKAKRVAEIESRFETTVAEQAATLGVNAERIAELQTQLDARVRDLDERGLLLARTHAALDEAERGGASDVARLEADLAAVKADCAAARSDLAVLETQLATERRDRAARESSRTWRIASVVERAATLSTSPMRLIRLRRHRMAIFPTHDLVVNEDGFDSIGPDPQFALTSSHRRLPRGWVKVVIYAGHADGLAPVVYVDSGSGFAEHDAYRLPDPREGRATAIVRLPRAVNALRLDPMPRPGHVPIRGVRISELGLLQVLCIAVYRHLIRVLGNPRKTVDLALRAIRLLRSGGTRAFLRGLFAWLNDRQETFEYREWVAAYDTLSAADRVAIERHVDSFVDPPVISVVMATYNTPRQWLSRSIESVRRQVYPRWELCIADDASTDPRVRPMLQDYARLDRRIKVVYREANGNISLAGNSALELASGPYVAFLDHDDELTDLALYFIAAELESHPEAALVYSDEDKVDGSGTRYEPNFKPDWNPLLLMGQNYMSHLSVYRADVVREVGGLREGYEGAQDWDLALRVTERLHSDQIRHVPRVLYHWRAIPGSTALATVEKGFALAAGRRALQSCIDRRGIRAEIQEHGAYFRVRRVVEDPPLVSIVIPTRDRQELLAGCVESIFSRTTYPAFEIVIADNESGEPESVRYLAELAERPNVCVVHKAGAFNYSAINNFAVREGAHGEIVCLLNNDIQVISPGWLDELVSLASLPDVGAVGAMLYYPDDTIQHAGAILGIGGVAGHAFLREPRGSGGYFGRAALVQNVSAVSAACLVVRRDVFEEVGGFDEENLAVAFNDIDLCLSMRERGYRNVWTPFAELYHFESASRGPEDSDGKRERFRAEIGYMQKRWGELLSADPAYNVNLTLDMASRSFAPATPPRGHKPWERVCAEQPWSGSELSQSPARPA